MTTLIASAVIVPAALAVDPLSNPCGDVETVFARGSGQAVGDPESERFFAQLPEDVNLYESVSLDGH